ncbi:MAG TPA: hypothetical protein VFP68_21375, partial [Burkholderiaceae bacterium]|nr:hypothetical protein [Burkholderiaceae bacterium]
AACLVALVVPLLAPTPPGGGALGDDVDEIWRLKQLRRLAELQAERYEIPSMQPVSLRDRGAAARKRKLERPRAAAAEPTRL